MLDRQFQQTLYDQIEWPPLSLTDTENLNLYTNFHTQITNKMYNLTCSSCGCISHSLDNMNELQFNDPALKLLSVSRDLVHYDFSTGVNVLDRDNIMINIKGLVDHEQTDSCSILCYFEICNR